MRQQVFITIALIGVTALAGCAKNGATEVQQAMQDVNVIDASSLNDVMLTVADPNEAVTYFSRASANSPDRIDLKRGLALSLGRANKAAEAVAAWQAVIGMPGATEDDKVNMAEAQIRAGQWTEAKATLDSVPPTHETFQRYKLEAMIADANKQWTKADSFYETAVGMTTQPAGVLNNWGYSKLTRGDFAGAEKLFSDAIRQDPTLFTAKNNLVLARGAQHNYTLPVFPMTQSERSQLLYTMALTAIKQNDVTIGRGLLQDAIDTNPQYFEAAVRSLQALDANVTH
ncbi:MAG: tetratricopeptide repeat protein [Limimaricola sp.]|uniref:tetratricopeptide repeat protein n=1 Tax=Limimaricola sp. TaxID=2211665 RepID=UPI001D7DE061|nr:tetratricopeptide repeat protein [Limimaricola sp.]MBI1415876.1 tetratricopeptide repeat protein [Limimaricola sp.]